MSQANIYSYISLAYTFLLVSFKGFCHVVQVLVHLFSLRDYLTCCKALPPLGLGAVLFSLQMTGSLWTGDCGHVTLEPSLANFSCV